MPFWKEGPGLKSLRTSAPELWFIVDELVGAGLFHWWRQPLCPAFLTSHLCTPLSFLFTLRVCQFCHCQIFYFPFCVHFVWADTVLLVCCLLIPATKRETSNIAIYFFCKNLLPVAQPCAVKWKLRPSLCLLTTLFWLQLLCLSLLPGLIPLLCWLLWYKNRHFLCHLQSTGTAGIAEATLLKSFFMIDSSNDSLSSDIMLTYNVYHIPLRDMRLSITVHQAITRHSV